VLTCETNCVFLKQGVEDLIHLLLLHTDLRFSYQLAGTFTLLTCLLTIFHMASHIRNMYEPIVQRKILAILWMSPIYGVTSFISLLVPATEGYLSIIKDFYEAYVIVSQKRKTFLLIFPVGLLIVF